MSDGGKFFTSYFEVSVEIGLGTKFVDEHFWVTIFDFYAALVIYIHNGPISQFSTENFALYMFRKSRINEEKRFASTLP